MAVVERSWPVKLPRGAADRTSSPIEYIVKSTRELKIENYQDIEKVIFGKLLRTMPCQFSFLD